jgi:hypothetical protein
MTDEQINVAIAEACGWVDRGSFNESRPEDHKFKRRIGNTENYEWRWQHEFNYCTDLNAMHEAEKVLTKAQWEDFVEHLSNGFFSVSDAWKDVCHATARQRAEAFLRTLGKREEAHKLTTKEGK